MFLFYKIYYEHKTKEYKWIFLRISFIEERYGMVGVASLHQTLAKSLLMLIAGKLM
jgi:hypothetical protein